MRTCHFCGRQEPEEQTLTWTSSTEDGVRHSYCDVCSRENLRSIEAKLDSEWW